MITVDIKTLNGKLLYRSGKDSATDALNDYRPGYWKQVERKEDADVMVDYVGWDDLMTGMLFKRVG